MVFVLFSCSTPTNDPTLYVPESSGPETPEPTVTYIGSKTPAETKAVGDIVFTDGSASPYTEELTDEQKAAAIAVIFYVGGENDTLGAKTLGVGLITERTDCMGLQWCLSDAVAYNNIDYAKNMGEKNESFKNSRHINLDVFSIAAGDGAGK